MHVWDLGLSCEAPLGQTLNLGKKIFPTLLEVAQEKHKTSFSGSPKTDLSNAALPHEQTGVPKTQARSDSALRHRHGRTLGKTATGSGGRGHESRAQQTPGPRACLQKRRIPPSSKASLDDTDDMDLTEKPLDEMEQPAKAPKTGDADKTVLPHRSIMTEADQQVTNLTKAAGASQGFVSGLLFGCPCRSRFWF